MAKDMNIAAYNHPEDHAGLHIAYSPINQAWFVMWHGEVLAVETSRQLAVSTLEEILHAKEDYQS